MTERPSVINFINMYEEHPLCTPPQNQTARIWRYMDVTKLLSMLDGSLWFSNITCVDDPLEGFLNRATVKKFRELPKDLPKINEEAVKKTIEENLKIIKWGRGLLNISSWHMNEGESAAMWQLYLKSENGIAIQSTYRRLRDSFKDSKEAVHIGIVKYIDEDDDTIDWRNVINYALHKRKSFEHEKELRAIVFSPSDNGGGSVDIDLEVLIEKIFVAPNSPKWTYELIKRTVRKYGFDKIPVEQSEMYPAPLY